MSALDAINDRWGTGTLHYASSGSPKPGRRISPPFTGLYDRLECASCCDSLTRPPLRRRREDRDVRPILHYVDFLAGFCLVGFRAARIPCIYTSSRCASSAMIVSCFSLVNGMGTKVGSSLPSDAWVSNCLSTLLRIRGVISGANLFYYTARQAGLVPDLVC